MKEHIETPNARLHSVKWACADANMSRKTLMKLANEANAVVKIGRMVRIDTNKLYAYLASVYEGN